LAEVHPGAQQPSPPLHSTMGACEHWALQVAALPTSESRVQASPSLQVDGQLPSQVSPVSRVLLPQVGEQSRSVTDVHPAGQQPSPLEQSLMEVCEHAAVQPAALPVSTSRVQAMESSQLVGQLPSQVSPPSTTPLPQLVEQSESLLRWQPAGQQPSPSAQAVTGVFVQRTSQVPAAPVFTSVVQALPSLQVDGQLPSHTSPGSTTLLPQCAEQSVSVAALQAEGQHPSPPAQAVMGSWTHASVQVEALPVEWSAVQASVSAHESGHAPGWPGPMPLSQVSPDSTAPLPHEALQSVSVFALQAAGQQPSPAVQAVTGVFVHTTSQLEGEPLRTSVVQALPSLQVAGQLPSHFSVPSTMPLPHRGWQSESLTALQPPGQQPSPSEQAVIVVLWQTSEQVVSLPVCESAVQAMLSLQEAGQAPGWPAAIALSQVSPVSTAPLPQPGRQSLSLLELHMAGQQPSPPEHSSILGFWQRTSQVPAEPVMTSWVQGLPSEQATGQLPSQVSPSSTTPLPHLGAQSESLTALQPAGQQPSPARQVVMSVCRHVAEQAEAEPSSVSAVQAFSSSHEAGHAPVAPAPIALSQASPGSTLALPQGETVGVSRSVPEQAASRVANARVRRT